MNALELIKHVNLKELESIYVGETPYIYENNYVPRVSAILSKTIHEDYLMDWANNLGKGGKCHKDFQKIATDYGSEVHRRAEILLGSNEEAKKEILELDDMKSFIALKDWVNFYGNRLVTIAQEQTLSCPWFGGTFDLLAAIDGRTFLIDFKTSKTITYKYCLQLAAYDLLIQYNAPTKIDGIIVLQLNKKTARFQEYILDFSNPGHYNYHTENMKTFLYLAQAYLSIIKSQNEFDNIKNSMMSYKI